MLYTTHFDRLTTVKMLAMKRISVVVIPDSSQIVARVQPLLPLYYEYSLMQENIYFFSRIFDILQYEI